MSRTVALGYKASVPDNIVLSQLEDYLARVMRRANVDVLASVMHPDPDVIFPPESDGPSIGDYKAWMNVPPTDVPSLQNTAADLDGDLSYEDFTEDNRRRAGWAALGVLAFAERTRCDEDLPTVLSDFLGDLLHLCDVAELSFDGLVDRGRHHYEAEIRGEL